MDKSLDFARYLYDQVTFDYTSLSLKENNKEELLKKRKFIKKFYKKYVDELMRYILEKDIANELIDSVGSTKLSQFKSTYNNDPTSTTILSFGVSLKKKIKKVVGTNIDNFILDKIWIDVANELVLLSEKRTK